MVIHTEYSHFYLESTSTGIPNVHLLVPRVQVHLHTHPYHTSPLHFSPFKSLPLCLAWALFVSHKRGVA